MCGVRKSRKEFDVQQNSKFFGVCVLCNLGIHVCEILRLRCAI